LTPSPAGLFRMSPSTTKMRLRTRYNWLVVDGKQTHLFAAERAKRATGNHVFEVPPEYREYLGLRGIELRPASFAEAEAWFNRRRRA